MSACDNCVFASHYCRARQVPLVTDAELDSDGFRRDVRSLIRALRLPPHRVLNFLTDCYRDADCAVVVSETGPIPFELDDLEFDNFPYWWRDLGRVPRPDVSTRLRRDRRGSFRTLATLLRVLFPAESRDWGKNDGRHIFSEGLWHTIQGNRDGRVETFVSCLGDPLQSGRALGC